jgi:hypothetical protein
MPPTDGARFDHAYRLLLQDKSIQFDLVPTVMPKPPAWLEGLLRGLSRLLGSLPFKIVFWTAVAIVVLALVAFILNYFWGVPLPWKRGRSEHQEEEPSWQPEAEPARALLREADALAAQGRFDEAAHLLLFRSIEDIDARRPRLVRPALTSRDIAGAPEIPVRPRTAFEAIVMMVERSLFGGRKLGETDWRECREHYEHFAFAEAWR